MSDGFLVGGVVRVPRRKLLGARRRPAPAVQGEVGLEDLEDVELRSPQAGLAAVK